MATDRLTFRQHSQGKALSKHVYHVQYCLILRSGSERSERKPVYDWILCGLSIRRLRPEGIDPLWGVSCRRRIYNTPQTFSSFFDELG